MTPSILISQISESTLYFYNTLFCVSVILCVIYSVRFLDVVYWMTPQHFTIIIMIIIMIIRKRVNLEKESMLIFTTKELSFCLDK